MGGSGTINGPVTINGPGSGVAGTIVGVNGSTFSLTGGLNLQTGSLSSFNLSGAPSGAMIATSSLSVNGTDTISFTSPQAGTYDLFSYTSISGFTNFQLNPTSVSNNSSYNFLLQLVSGQVDVTVTAPPISWTGNNNGSPPSSVWDTGTFNWANAGGTAVTFAATAAVATSDVATGTATAGNDSGTDPFTAIQAAIASGSISSTKGAQLENRLAAIERPAATDPGLDVSLLEDRILAALPPTSVWSSSGTAPLVEIGSGLLAVDRHWAAQPLSLRPRILVAVQPRFRNPPPCCSPFSAASASGSHSAVEPLIALPEEHRGNSPRG